MDHPVKNLIELSKYYALKDKESFDFQDNWGSTVQCTLSTKHGTNGVLCTCFACILSVIFDPRSLLNPALDLPGLCSAKAGLLLVQPGG